MESQVINDRFRLGEKLGAGGMAVVYQATDLESGRDVALKLMKSSLNGTSKRRFAREFRAIASVDHPNCIRVFDFAETGDVPFFTMEIFRGGPITELIDKGLPAIYSGLYQSASAIEYVHEQQIIHRDLKPSNLLTTIVENSGSVDVVTKLADFGLARFYGSPSSLSIDSGFVGTLAYSAPEQISNSVIDYRCDIYALGVVAYELLCGRHPFESSREGGAQSLMRAHLTEVPLPICSRRPEVPRELDEIVLSMLEKHAANRPLSVAAVCALLKNELGIEEADEDTTTTSDEARWKTQTFVARESELAEVSRVMTTSLSPIQFSLDEPEQLAPSVVFVTGDAGMGKSHFLREVSRLARRHGSDVFEGRCFEGNLAPYQPFVEIIRQMLMQLGNDGLVAPTSPVSSVHTLRGSTSERLSVRRSASSLEKTELYEVRGSETLQDVVQNYSAELLRIAPDLHTLLPGKAFRQVDLNREANYVLRAIATYFVEISTFHGTCLMIEDVHWIDQSSLDLLRHIASILQHRRKDSVDSNRSYPRLFICCTARRDNEKLMAELERERYAKSVPLSALNTKEVEQLVSIFLGVRPEKIGGGLVQQVAHRCKGNPYFVTETLRSWQTGNRIVFQDDRWALDDSEDGSTSDWPDSVRGVLRSRLRNISQSGQQVLAPAAVIGAIVPVDLLRQSVAEMDENEFLDTLDELLGKQVLYETSDPAVLEFTHDLLRELTYEQLASHRRRALHRRVGNVLEKAGKGRTSPQQLAGHFYEAREVDNAFPYLLEASEKALASYAIDEALSHLKRASELETQIDDRTLRFRMHGLTATSHNALGHPVEAIKSLERQLDLSGSDVDTGSILAEIGEVHFRVGDFDGAVLFFDSALEKIGDRRPRSSLGVLVSTAVTFGRAMLPGFVNRRRLFRRRRRDRDQVAIRSFSTLEVLWAQRDVLLCGQAHARHVLLAAQLGDPSYLTHASARQALIFGIFSLNALALRAGRRALTYAMRESSPEAEAIAKGHVGCAHYFGARLQDAEKLLMESLALLDRRGDSWERLYFYHNLRHLYSITGDASREIECARVEMQIGEAVNDPEGTCWGAYGVANALSRLGKHEEAHQYMERALGILAGRINIVVTPTALSTYGMVHMQSGNFEAAREVLFESCRSIRKDLAFIEYTVRAYPLLVESLLGPRWYHPDTVPDDKTVAQAWRISRAAKFWAWRFPNYMPHALRVRGRAAWCSGRKSKAIACLQRAIKVGNQIGADYEVARARIDLSRLEIDSSDQHGQQGRAMLEKLSAVLPVGEDP